MPFLLNLAGKRSLKGVGGKPKRAEARTSSRKDISDQISTAKNSHVGTLIYLGRIPIFFTLQRNIKKKYLV